MTQKYTKVAWQDETTSQQGTLINAERLDQMQTAHHYADGFEEVDTVPTDDPNVDYHKVVFCTADTTFYRWDGTQWVKDVDDDTKALLLAHEADHNNPHVVTKAQVGLGNCDNTADLDKPVSTAMQAALDDKVTIIPVTSGVKFYSQSSGGTSLYQGTSSPVTGITSVPMRDSSGRIKTAAPSADDDTANKKYVDDADALKVNKSSIVSAWQGTPDDAHIPSEKLVKTYIDTSLTDGSVTKVGTGTVGGNLKPIYLNAGVPTAVTNDLVSTSGNQDIAGVKTFTSNPIISKGTPVLHLSDSYMVWDETPANNRYCGLSFDDKNGAQAGGITLGEYTNDTKEIYLFAKAKNGNTSKLSLYNPADGKAYVTGPSRTYNASNTNDIVNIALLDAYTPMVRTTNAQTIAGVKTFTDAPYTQINSADGVNIHLRNNNLTLADQTGGHNTSIAIRGASDALLARLRYRNGVMDNLPTRNFQVDLYDAGGTAHVFELCRLQNGVEYGPVLTGGDQTIQGVKTFYSTQFSDVGIKSARVNDNIGGISFFKNDNTRVSQIYAHTNGNLILNTNANGRIIAQNQAAYNPANTDDIVTVGTLDTYTPMVRTTNNQNIAGTKRFTNALFGTSFKSSEVVATGSGTKYWKIAVIPDLASRRYFSFRGLIGRSSILSMFGIGGQYTSSTYTISMNILSNVTISTPQAEIGMGSINNEECIIIKTLRQTTVSMTILDCITGSGDNPTDITFVTPEEVTEPSNFVSAGAIA